MKVKYECKVIDKGNMKAVGTLTIDGVRIYGVKIVEGKNGLFVALPSYKGKDGAYHNQVGIDESVYEKICKFCIAEYKKKAPDESLDPEEWEEL